jgi:hypothetical protein
MSLNPLGLLVALGLLGGCASRMAFTMSLLPRP